MEAQIAAARGFEPCPSCGSADVTWRGRRWYESLRRALANAIEWPLTVLASSSRKKHSDMSHTIDDPSVRRVEAEQYWRLRNARDRRIAAMPPRIWQCASCDKRGEVIPDIDLVLAEYEGDLRKFEAGMTLLSLPDQTVTLPSEVGDGHPPGTPIV